ncbi:MAG: pseudouridine-5'-phosphate glycosidase [Chloroflexi bacterium]|nr:MAG: pseudouridine-5'-phosphate glycosidase [Chloroflexota bacterium]
MNAPPGADLLRVSEEVREALESRRPVVALESSLIAQGLPAPHNIETANAAEAAVREEGAVPATTAIEAGALLVGAPRQILERLADPESRPAKAASRDLGLALASGRLASTTVSASLRIAHWAGIELFATGGIGGVHRGAGQSFDVSSDIDELAATPVAVVCSGAKSILDLPATLEMLETRRVPVIGIGTDQLPGFFTAATGLPLSHSVSGLSEAAQLIGLHHSIPGAASLLFVQPPPAELALERDKVERWIEDALVEAASANVRGGEVTPFVLQRLSALSGGATVRTNIGLIVNNARTAARIARARSQPNTA